MTIKFHDDKKEKHQSHEARFMIGLDELGERLNDLGYLGDVGYGTNREEAQADLISEAKHLVEHLEKLTAEIKELIEKHDTNNRDVGSPRNG